MDFNLFEQRKIKRIVDAMKSDLDVQDTPLGVYTPKYPLKTVYLAGPITGLTREGARLAWRPSFAKLLPPHIFPLSPMRLVQNLMPETGLVGIRDPQGVEEMLVNRSILARDENDLRIADAIVANLTGASIVSIGTVGEINMAHILRKPVVLVMDWKGNLHEHPFVTAHAAFRTDSMEEAAGYVAHLLTPGV